MGPKDSSTQIAPIFRSSVTIKPFVAVLESPLLLVRVPESRQRVPSTISCGSIWLDTQGEIPYTPALKKRVLIIKWLLVTVVHVVAKLVLSLMI
jgi:hypothetical protein